MRDYLSARAAISETFLVTVTTTDTGWVNLSIPLLSRHILFVAFNSITWNIHNKMNHFICSEVPCHYLGTEIRNTLKNWQFC